MQVVSAHLLGIIVIIALFPNMGQLGKENTLGMALIFFFWEANLNSCIFPYI